MELGHGLASPDSEDVSNVAPRTCTEKPMAGSDFNRVERELIHQIHPSQGLRSMVYIYVYIYAHFRKVHKTSIKYNKLNQSF